jgi:hypothetical protein
MPTYTVQAPNGQTYSIPGPPGATDDQVRAQIMAQHPEAGKAAASPNPWVDAAKSYVSGLARGASSLADSAIAAVPGADFAVKAGMGASNIVNRAVGLKPVFGAVTPQSLAASASPIHSPFAPTPGALSEGVTPILHTPQTEAGRWADTAGQMTPAGLAPGSLVARAANVILPTVGSQGAADVAQGLGASPGVVNAARTVGALAGGGVASVRMGPSSMAAPVSGEDLAATLKTAKNQAYAAADNAGVQYKPQAVADLATNIKSDLAGARYDPDFHPVVAKVVNKIDSKVSDGWSPSLSELDDLRKFVGENLGSSSSPTEARLGNVIKGNIDNFIQNATPDQVTGGTADGAARLISNARDLNTRYMKVQAVNEALDKAGLQAGKSGSGGNIDNATRQRMASLLDSIPNLSDEEQAAVRGIVMGGQGQNLLRQAGKLSPQGNGLMAAGNLGAAAFGGPLGAIPGVAGLLSKMAADGITRSKVQGLVQLMANGGSKAGGVAGPAPQISQAVTPKLSGPNPYAMPAAVLTTLSASPVAAHERQRPAR